jgi:hypothetical protein
MTNYPKILILMIFYYLCLHHGWYMMYIQEKIKLVLVILLKKVLLQYLQ